MILEFFISLFCHFALCSTLFLGSFFIPQLPSPSLPSLEKEVFCDIPLDIEAVAEESSAPPAKPLSAPPSSPQDLLFSESQEQPQEQPKNLQESSSEDEAHNLLQNALSRLEDDLQKEKNIQDQQEEEKRKEEFLKEEKERKEKEKQEEELEKKIEEEKIKEKKLEEEKKLKEKKLEEKRLEEKRLEEQKAEEKRLEKQKQAEKKLEEKKQKEKEQELQKKKEEAKKKNQENKKILSAFQQKRQKKLAALIKSKSQGSSEGGITPITDPSSTSSYSAGAIGPLALSIGDRLRRILEGSISLPLDIRRYGDFYIRVFLEMNSDGTIKRYSILPGGSSTQHPLYQQGSQSVRQSLEAFKHQPLPLPLEHYHLWKTVTVTIRG